MYLLLQHKCAELYFPKHDINFDLGAAKLE